MSKLRLQLEDLAVDTFDTTAVKKTRGTVFGEQCTCYTVCTCPGCPTCDGTCPNTCPYTCDDVSCAGTCDDTCAYDCDASGGGTCDRSCLMSCNGDHTCLC